MTEVSHTSTDNNSCVIGILFCNLCKVQKANRVLEQVFESDCFVKNLKVELLYRNYTGSRSTMASTSTFKVPSEPCPLPSLGSDEESFVVLGKSLVSDFEQSPVENDLPVGNSIIQEAKQLISRELSQIEEEHTKAQASKETNEQCVSVSSSRLWESQADAATDKDGADKQQMEQSVALPEMPKVMNTFNADTTSNTPISIVSFSTELSNDETQSKIAEIIEENIHLKNTILQNNTSMKSQYERIVAWQEDVQKVHESHKKKFTEAKEFIEKLKNENYNLKQALEVEKQLRNAMESEILILKNTDKEKDSVDSKLLQSFEKEAKENIEMLKKENLDFKHALEVEKELRKTLESEILTLKNSDKETLNTKLLQSSENNLKEFELNSANKKIKELEAALAESKLKLNEFDEMSANLKTFKENSENMPEICKQLSEKHENLLAEQTKLKAANEKIAKFEEDINNLMKLVQQRDQELKQINIERIETRSRLEEEIHTMRTHQQRSQVFNTEELSGLRHQLMNMQMSLTQSEHSRVAAFNQAQAALKELEDIKKQQVSVQEEKDDLFALKTQLDVYKADFEAEREAKDTVKSENIKLTADLQHLQRRNQQLQEEIEYYRERDYVHVRPSTAYQSSTRSSRPSAPGSTSSASSGGNSEEPLYRCPKCQFGFHSVKTLESHVYRCIELDDHLP